MLHHPNIVEYYGIEVHRDKVYILKEFCQAVVAALLEHGRIEDEGTYKYYTMQMFRGSGVFHSQGIVHRDIKPTVRSNFYSIILYVIIGMGRISWLDILGLSSLLTLGQPKFSPKTSARSALSARFWKWPGECIWEMNT